MIFPVAATISKVLTDTKNGVNAYNVEPEYNGNALTARDKSTIQGYFSK